MQPPAKLNVLDNHGGFTCESKSPREVKQRMNFVERRRVHQGKLWIGDTLWRSGSILKGVSIGRLLDYDEHSFYQDNDDATQAVYRVQGYGYPVLVWFDNKSHKRIA